MTIKIHPNIFDGGIGVKDLAGTHLSFPNRNALSSLVIPVIFDLGSLHSTGSRICPDRIRRTGVFNSTVYRDKVMKDSTRCSLHWLSHVGPEDIHGATTLEAKSIAHSSLRFSVGNSYRKWIVRASSCARPHLYGSSCACPHLYLRTSSIS